MPGRPAPSGGAAAVAVITFGNAMFAIDGAGAQTVFYGFLLLASLPVYVRVRAGLRRAQG